jgi:hypothetical protein
LDLIGKKPNGILQILDDESNFPKVNQNVGLFQKRKSGLNVLI